MFFLSDFEINSVKEEAKKFKIEINEQDISKCDRNAKKLYKKKSITDEVIQNLVDDPEDDEILGGDNLVDEAGVSGEQDVKEKFKADIINKIVE